MNPNLQVETLPGPQQLLELPQDLLRTILGLLDVLSLCTARLVCRDFWRSASGHLVSLRLPSTALEQPPTSMFTQLSGLVCVKVSVASEEQLQMLAHPQIASVVTHVDLQLTPLPERLDQLSLLPNLCEVSVHGEVRGNNLLPPGLQQLHIKVPIRKRASWLTGFSALENLKIHLVAGAGRSLGRLTTLRNLRFLGLHCGVSALRVLSTFTMLTALEWEVARSYRTGPAISLHRVAHLTRVSHLLLKDRGRTMRHERVAPLSRLTKLTHLDINRTPLAECVLGSSFLVPLTGLVSLGLDTVGMSLLPSLNVEALQRLTLQCETGDVSVLLRATGLTELEFWWGSEIPQGLEPTLALMTRLQSLTVFLYSEDKGPVPFRLNLVLPSLTRVKRLWYSGKITVGSDLRACASLPSLRTFALHSVPDITPDCLPALQAMSGLNQLVLTGTGIHPEHVTPEVRAAFDVERSLRGWPRLYMSINYINV